MGIEPTYPAWKAGVLPLNYTRGIYIHSIGVTGFEPATSWSQTRRSSQTEPHPDVHKKCFSATQGLLYTNHYFLSTTFLHFTANFTRYLIFTVLTGSLRAPGVVPFGLCLFKPHPERSHPPAALPHPIPPRPDTGPYAGVFTFFCLRDLALGLLLLLFSYGP